MKTVARTIAGTAYRILMSLSISQEPIQPWVPKISTSINPAITGETEKGISIRVVRNDLPRKLNLATDHAAATPNMTLSGTAIAAVNRVSFCRQGIRMYQSLGINTYSLFESFYKTRISGRIRQLKRKVVQW